VVLGRLSAQVHSTPRRPALSLHAALPILEQAILFRKPSIVVDDVPADLIQLARDCLQKDPQLRRRFVRWNRFLRPETQRSADDRSEEHTSELQSRENLVCRLLLEKKKPDD